MNEPFLGARDRGGALAGLAALVLATGGGCGGPRVSVPNTNPRYEFQVGQSEFARGHWVDAQAHLKRFLDLYPGQAPADSAQLLIALSLFGEKSFAEAAVEFAVLGREYPRSALADAAAYHECWCYFRQMRSPQLDPTFAFRARDCMNEFLLRYPETTYRGEAEKRLAEITDRLAEKELRLGILFVKIKQPLAARIYLEGLCRDYPTSSWVPQALLWVGRSYEDQDRNAEAAQSYRRLISTYPDNGASKEARARLRQLTGRHPDLQGSPAAGAASATP